MLKSTPRPTSDDACQAWKAALESGERIEETSEVLFKLLRDYAGAIVWNTLRREDAFLVQDIVTLAFMKAKTFQGTSNFGTWFYRLAFNQCLKDLRFKRRRKEVFLDDLLSEPAATTAEPSEILQTLAGIRSKLDYDDFHLIDLRLEGYALKEIAVLQNKSYEDVRVAWRTCKDRVKRLLEKFTPKDVT